MTKEWLSGNDGKNLKFKRETLLNYGLNRWGLNKAHSVGPTSELIRSCAPTTFEEWEEFYFSNAIQKKNDGIKITKEYLISLGQTLYIKLTEVIQNELESISEEECIDYVYNFGWNGHVAMAKPPLRPYKQFSRIRPSRRFPFTGNVKTTRVEAHLALSCISKTIDPIVPNHLLTV